ncbi:MAG: hypothetical protein SVU88_04775, partial [Candidatus Nanohaloarchaea archaeon]|nr:hypothetical protein [Candidatus Nanohaloarchaea archaeon]
MAADSGDGGESGGSETELVTLRMEQAMIDDLDSLDFPSRSHAIREATGSKVLERRLEEQRADGID